MSYRGMLVFGLLALAPSAAVGQFTTFIPRQTKAQDSAKAAVATQQRARADSVTAAHLTNMKTWVDSASGVVVPSTRADSLSRTDSLALPRAAAETSTFRNGSPAPMTASSLPLMVAIGAGALVLGALVLSTVPRDRRA